MPVSVSKINYSGWPNCYQITDGNIELIAVADIGPRIIRLGFVNEPNLFGEFPKQVGQIGGSKWQIYGGHRLWHSPEALPRTYLPDNMAVKVKVLANGVRLKQPVETGTGIIKEMIVTLDEKCHSFMVEHRLTNAGAWPVTLAVWPVSVMNTGGVAVVPQYRENGPETKLPNRVLALWSYTDMNDPRVEWGDRYIFLTQDLRISKHFKLGLSVPEGWLAYVVDGYLLLKKFPYDSSRTYPDGGVNIELYADARIMELETLGPLETVLPGMTVTHSETWSLYQGIGRVDTGTDVERKIIPLIK